MLRCELSDGRGVGLTKGPSVAVALALEPVRFPLLEIELGISVAQLGAIRVHALLDHGHSLPVPGPGPEEHECEGAHDGRDRDHQSEDHGVEKAIHDPYATHRGD